MQSFELAADLPLIMTKNLSGSDINVSVDKNGPLSSHSVESLRRVKSGDEYFVIDSYDLRRRISRE